MPAAGGSLVRDREARLHPPHSHCERLRTRRFRGDGARDLPLSPQLERLERHWLQLPGRQVRHDLRGPSRRHRCSRRRRPGTGLQRPVGRRVEPRHVQHHGTERGRAQRARAPFGVEAGDPGRAADRDRHGHLDRWSAEPLPGRRAGHVATHLRSP